MTTRDPRQRTKPEIPKTQDAIADRFASLRKQYDEDNSTKYARILLYGPWGTGKTTLAATMPGPIYFDTFDPGGDKLGIMREGVKNDRIFINKQWAKRAFNDSQDSFVAWNRHYNQLKREGFFNHVGTYVLDSTTTFQRLVVDATIGGNTKNTIVSSKMPIKIPEIRDYNVQDAAMMMIFQDILELPCHVVVIAHMERDEDEATGVMETKPLITGKKLRERMPTLFDEIYVTRYRGKTWELLTKPEGFWMARTRLGSMFPIQAKYQSDKVGGIHLTRDILVPAGYAYKEDIVEYKDI